MRVCPRAEALFPVAGWGRSRTIRFGEKLGEVMVSELRGLSDLPLFSSRPLLSHPILYALDAMKSSITTNCQVQRIDHRDPPVRPLAIATSDFRHTLTTANGPHSTNYVLGLSVVIGWCSCQSSAGWNEIPDLSFHILAALLPSWQVSLIRDKNSCHCHNI